MTTDLTLKVILDNGKEYTLTVNSILEANERMNFISKHGFKYETGDKIIFYPIHRINEIVIKGDFKKEHNV